MAFKLNGQEQRNITLIDLHHRFAINSHILGANFKQYPTNREPDSSGRIVPDFTRYVIHPTCTPTQIETYLPNANPVDIRRGNFSFQLFERDSVKDMRITPLEPL